jgi:ABC-type lipoprotein export system ATPase subunit
MRSAILCVPSYARSSGETIAADAVVVVDGVVKVYDDEGVEPVRALDGVSLAVRKGEMVGLMGPSGCGKSTLLNLIGCIDLPSSGIVAIEGRATSALGDAGLTVLRRDRIGTVFQFFSLLPALTVAENVGLPLVLQRRPRAEVARRVAETLEAMGIADKSARLPSELSGGQAQRAAIARAIVHRPAVVLADEPTGNLDSRNGAVVLDLLRSLANAGQAIVMATHSPEAAAACDRIVHLQDGRIAT